MVKNIFINLKNSLWLYVLTLCNIAHAITDQDYDWLLWVSVVLTCASVLLNIVSAIQKGDQNA